MSLMPTDLILQQKINERNNMDVTFGARPMHPSSHIPQPQPQPQLQLQPQSRGSVNVHPSTIHKFLSMDQVAQQRLYQSQPVLVQQILDTIARQSQSPQGSQSQSQSQTLQSPQTLQSLQGLPGPQTQQSSQSQSHERDRDDSSIDTPCSTDLENSHSSEEEEEKERSKTKNKKTRRLRISSPRIETNQNVHQYGKKIYLSLDFRINLSEINNDAYILSFPSQHNILSLNLQSCLINRNQTLESEPYIYISIAEIEGDYQVNTGHQSHAVFGKLIQEKTVNDFIVYKAENCNKAFNKPIKIDTLTITLLKYDMTPISLNKMQVERLTRSKDFLKLNTKSTHYLSVGDRVNISQCHDDQVSVDTVDVIKVIKDDMVALENPVNKIGTGTNLQFEKVDIKCTLTFCLASKL